MFGYNGIAFNHESRVRGVIFATHEKARAQLGWSAKIRFEQLAGEMVTGDLKPVERDELVKRHGHRPYDYHE